MSDLIRREDAYDMVRNAASMSDALDAIDALPAVQPAHVNKTPKSEHDERDVLTPATGDA